MINPNNNSKTQSPYSTTPYHIFHQAQPNPNHGKENSGTHIMGMATDPSSHPDNRKVALQSGANEKQQQPQDQNCYVQHNSVEKPSSKHIQTILHSIDYLSKNAGTIGNVWNNLKTSPSISSAALGKVNLTVKAITEGGFESLYKQTFSTYPNEKMKKSFACYLSTSTGPVAGTLYLSNIHVAFCSDRPLCSTAPSGLETWSHYKVMVPLQKIQVVNPATMKDNSSEKYIQIVTVDKHDFWFMGFINYDKGINHLSEAISHFVVSGTNVPSTSY